MYPLLNDIIIDLAEKMMKENICQEIDGTIRDKLEEKRYTDETVTSATNAWYEKVIDKIPPEILILGIAISSDMDWQKKSTGKLYGSLSGYVYKIGCRKGESIGLSVKCKKCSVSHTANWFSTVAAEHKYVINWIGASVAMEAGVALEMVTNLYNELLK